MDAFNEYESRNHYVIRGHATSVQRLYFVWIYRRRAQRTRRGRHYRRLRTQTAFLFGHFPRASASGGNRLHSIFFEYLERVSIAALLSEQRDEMADDVSRI